MYMSVFMPLLAGLYFELLGMHGALLAGLGTTFLMRGMMEKYIGNAPEATPNSYLRHIGFGALLVVVSLVTSANTPSGFGSWIMGNSL